MSGRPKRAAAAQAKANLASGDYSSVVKQATQRSVGNEASSATKKRRAKVKLDCNQDDGAFLEEKVLEYLEEVARSSPQPEMQTATDIYNALNSKYNLTCSGYKKGEYEKNAKTKVGDLVLLTLAPRLKSLTESDPVAAAASPLRLIDITQQIKRAGRRPEVVAKKAVAVAGNAEEMEEARAQRVYDAIKVQRHTASAGVELDYRELGCRGQSITERELAGVTVSDALGWETIPPWLTVKASRYTAAQRFRALRRVLVGFPGDKKLYFLFSDFSNPKVDFWFALDRDIALEAAAAPEFPELARVVDYVFPSHVKTNLCTRGPDFGDLADLRCTTAVERSTRRVLTKESSIVRLAVEDMPAGYGLADYVVLRDDDAPLEHRVQPSEGLRLGIACEIRGGKLGVALAQLGDTYGEPLRQESQTRYRPDAAAAGHTFDALDGEMRDAKAWEREDASGYDIGQVFVAAALNVGRLDSISWAVRRDVFETLPSSFVASQYSPTLQIERAQQALLAPLIRFVTGCDYGPSAGDHECSLLGEAYDGEAAPFAGSPVPQMRKEVTHFEAKTRSEQVESRSDSADVEHGLARLPADPRHCDIVVGFDLGVHGSSSYQIDGKRTPFSIQNIAQTLDEINKLYEAMHACADDADREEAFWKFLKASVILKRVRMYLLSVSDATDKSFACRVDFSKGASQIKADVVEALANCLRRRDAWRAAPPGADELQRKGPRLRSEDYFKLVLHPDLPDDARVAASPPPPTSCLEPEPLNLDYREPPWLAAVARRDRAMEAHLAAKRARATWRTRTRSSRTRAARPRALADAGDPDAIHSVADGHFEEGLTAALQNECSRLRREADGFRRERDALAARLASQDALAATLPAKTLERALKPKLGDLSDLRLLGLIGKGSEVLHQSLRDQVGDDSLDLEFDEAAGFDLSGQSAAQISDLVLFSLKGLNTALRAPDAPTAAARRASASTGLEPTTSGGLLRCKLDCKRVYFGTELHFGAGLVITEQAINLEWKSQLTGGHCQVAIQARDIESMAYKTQDDADAGPIDLCGDDERADLSDGGRVVKFLALTLVKSASVGNAVSRECFDPSQNPGPHCHVVLDLAGSAASVFIDDVLGFLYDHYSHATINPISGADAAAPYLLGVTDADAREKRRAAEQKRNEVEPAAAAPRGGSKRKRGAARSGGSKRESGAPQYINLVDDPANAEAVFTFPSAKAKDAITCLRGDRLRLQDGEFLNDNLINLYLKNKMQNQPAPVARVHVFSTFFFTKMLEAEAFPGSFDAKKAYAKVKKWTKKVDVFDQDLLFVPVNEHLHWSLAVVVNPGKKPSQRTAATPDPSEPYILAMDSLRSHDKARVAEYLRAYLKCAWADRHASRDLDGRFEAETMPVFAPDLPKQRNSFDCGVYVLKFFDLLFDKPLPARAADDDMTFSNQFRKTLFKREDVKAKREQLLHFFDLEWEKAGGPKASKPKKRARQADDDGAPLSKRPRTP